MFQRISGGRRSVEGKLRWIKKNQPAQVDDYWDSFVFHVLEPWLLGRAVAGDGASPHSREARLVALGSTPYDGLIPWLWREWRKDMATNRQIMKAAGRYIDGLPGTLNRMNSNARNIRDWYVGTRPDIMRYSMLTASAAADRWHHEQEARAATGKKLSASVLKAFQLAQRWPDGHWVGVYRGPGLRSLQTVGKLLGHCYQRADLAEAYTEDDNTIWTLFDPDGRPRWTMAAESREPLSIDPMHFVQINEIKGPQNMPVRPKDFPYLQDLIGPVLEYHGQPQGDEDVPAMIVAEFYDYGNALGLFKYAQPDTIYVDGDELSFMGKDGQQYTATRGGFGLFKLGLHCGEERYTLRVTQPPGPRRGMWATTVPAGWVMFDTLDQFFKYHLKQLEAKPPC